MIVLFILFCLISGCGGYRFASEFNNLPGGISSISIPFFKNETYEYNIEAYFTNSLISEFIKNKKISILPQGADATLYGVVKEFRTQTISFSYAKKDNTQNNSKNNAQQNQDRALEYRAFVVLELTLKNNQTGETLWKKSNFIHDTEYRVVAEDIAFSEANKKIAFLKIANEVAVQIYEELVLGF